MVTSSACVKYILFAFNLLIWILGGAMMSMAIYIHCDEKFWEYSDKIPINQYYTAIYLLIVAGSLLLIMAFIGCCGTATESPALLLGYIIGMFILVVLEFTGAAHVWKMPSSEQLQLHLEDHINFYIRNSGSDFESKQFLDHMQLHLQCCGSESYKDYEIEKLRNPETCHDPETNNLNHQGCAPALRVWLEIRGAWLGSLALCSALLQIAAMVFSGGLYKALKMDVEAYV